MTNLETMEKGIYYTTTAYTSTYYNTTSPVELNADAVAYSAQALYKVIKAPDGMCRDYTRKGNLRYEIAALGKDAIQNELLKNIVNVARYQVLTDTRAGNELGGVIRSGMSSDQIAVIVFNAMVNGGVEKGYEMLNDPNILFSACKSFADYRREGKKQAMDNIAVNDNVAVYMQNELDVYYARYGDRPKAVDTTVLNQADAPSFGGK